MRLRSKSGQAVLEMAVFGSLVLLILGILFSYMQRLNDQQYVQMESFRRALEKGCNYTGASSGGAGAAVSLSLMQNRKHVEVGGNFAKGSPQALSASSSVFWAVPFVGNSAEQVILLRVNEDEHEIDNPPEDFKGVDDIETSAAVKYEGRDTKLEEPAAITNIHRAKISKDTINTKFVDEDKQVIWEVTQGAYRERESLDGEYKDKYDDAHVNTQIERERVWRTEF